MAGRKLAPVSGEEYIKIVQQEREGLPGWLRAHTVETQPATHTPADATDGSIDTRVLPRELLPKRGWAEARLRDAEGVRAALTQPDFASGKSAAGLDRKTPHVNSKEPIWRKWWDANLDNPIAGVRSLSQPLLLRLLEFFVDWIEELTEPPQWPEHETTRQTMLQMSKWLYFLLCKCDPILEADDQFTVRTLAKRCQVARLQTLSPPNSDTTRDPNDGASTGPAQNEAQPNHLFVGLTIVILIVSRGWFGQKDLQDPVQDPA
ncbi:gem (nuclear organelle) associated protein 2 [Kappamyces sp. JEL0829]|nr:gem (nuclear organelle) associated protein 2 [Kappamyces sp. JEL0829]